MRPDAPAQLLYDGDCRICTAFARAVAFASGRRSLRAKPIQDSLASLPGMSEAEALAAVHMVSPDGRVRSGPAVLPAIAGALLAQPHLEDRVNASPWGRAAADRTYEVLVALRGRLNCATGASSSVGRNPR